MTNEYDDFDKMPKNIEKFDNLDKPIFQCKIVSINHTHIVITQKYKIYYYTSQTTSDINYELLKLYTDNNTYIPRGYMILLMNMFNLFGNIIISEPDKRLNRYSLYLRTDDSLYASNVINWLLCVNTKNNMKLNLKKFIENNEKITSLHEKEIYNKDNKINKLETEIKKLETEINNLNDKICDYELHYIPIV